VSEDLADSTIQIPLPKLTQLTIEQDLEKRIRSLINQKKRHSLKSYYKDREDAIESFHRLLQRLRNNNLNTSDLKQALNDFNDLTGSLGERELGVQNIDRLLENPHLKIMRSLRFLLFDETSPLRDRIDGLLTGNEHLVGGSLGFVSTMLFLHDSSRYNIYNSGVLRGLRTVLPDADTREAFTGEDYQLFNDLVKVFKDRFSLKNEEVEHVLWAIGRHQHEE